MSVLVERPSSVRLDGSGVREVRGGRPVRDASDACVRRESGHSSVGRASSGRAASDRAASGRAGGAGPREVRPVRRAPRRVHGERTVRSIGDRPATRRAVSRSAGVGVAAACSVRPAARPMRVLVGVGVLSAMAIVLLAALGAFGSAGAVPDRTAVVQVHQGQTLTELAAASAPDSDRSAVISRIEDLNGLSSGVLRAGQSLVVPVSTTGTSVAAAE